MHGPGAAQAGEGEDNLVLKAARALAKRRPATILGAFRLDKKVPVAAGLGGGSADAGAALRLVAQANGLPSDDPNLYAAARAIGADVPVCLDPRPRIMRGIGEMLSPRWLCPSCQRCLSTRVSPYQPKRSLPNGRQPPSMGLPLISMRLQSFLAAIKFCSFSARNRTISNRRRSRFSRSSPECSRRCANSQDASSPACPDQARLALLSSPRPRRHVKRRK